MEDGRQDPEDTILVFGTEVKYFHGAEEPAEVVSIIFANNPTVSTLTNAYLSKIHRLYYNLESSQLMKAQPHLVEVIIRLSLLKVKRLFLL